MHGVKTMWFMKRCLISENILQLSSPKHSQIMQLMMVFVWLCLVTPARAQNDHSVICYMDSSMQSLPFPVHRLLCTHVIHTAAYIGDDSTFKTQDLDTGFVSTRTLKHRNPTLKTLLGVVVKQSRLELMSQSQSTLENFISSALNYVKEKNYDGLELTWVATSGTLSDSRTLTSFLKALREQIVKQTDLASKNSLLVLVSLLEGTHTDEQTIAQYVDFISLLPLNPNLDQEQINNTVQYWQDQGVEPKMLILTLSALVRWPSQRQNETSLSTVDMNPETEKTYGPELIMATQLCQAIKRGQKELNTVTNLEDLQSHGEEVAWMLEKGLAGVGIVFVDIDKFGNSTGDGCTQSEMAVLESKVITVFPHRTHLRHGGYHHHRHHWGHHQHEHLHQGHRHHGLHRHRHRHHEHHDHSQHVPGHHRHGHRHHDHSQHGPEHRHGHGHHRHDHTGHSHHSRH